MITPLQISNLPFNKPKRKVIRRRMTFALCRTSWKRLKRRWRWTRAPPPDLAIHSTYPKQGPLHKKKTTPRDPHLRRQTERPSSPVLRNIHTTQTRRRVDRPIKHSSSTGRKRMGRTQLSQNQPLTPFGQEPAQSARVSASPAEFSAIRDVATAWYADSFVPFTLTSRSGDPSARVS